MIKYPNASFRLGDLADEVAARGKNAGQVAKRDLARYYFLLRRVLPRFDEEQAGFILESIHRLQSIAPQITQRGGRSRPSTDLVKEYRNSLWTTVRLADNTFALSESFSVDLKKLETRLRKLQPWEELAVLDAVERALRLRGWDARRAAVKVGLA